MIIAVDFDGTIVEHRYPSIGPEIPFAIKTLKLLCEEQHHLHSTDISNPAPKSVLRLLKKLFK